MKSKLRKLIYIKGQIWDLAKLLSCTEYRMNELFGNIQFFKPILIVQIENILEIRSFYNLNNSEDLKFKKIQKFAIFTIRTIQNSGNSKKFQFRKSQKFLIWKNSKIFNLENSKTFQFEKFKKLPIKRIRKISIF